MDGAAFDCEMPRNSFAASRLGRMRITFSFDGEDAEAVDLEDDHGS